MSKTLGQVAYEAYGDARGWKVVSGLSMPAWDEQTPDLCGAWERSAEAVERVVKGERP